MEIAGIGAGAVGVAEACTAGMAETGATSALGGVAVNITMLT